MGENSSPKREAKPPSPSTNGIPKKVTRGIDEIPEGPLDRSVQLIRTSRMISPKASVTIAR